MCRRRKKAPASGTQGFERRGAELIARTIALFLYNRFMFALNENYTGQTRRALQEGRDYKWVPYSLSLTYTSGDGKRFRGFEVKFIDARLACSVYVWPGETVDAELSSALTADVEKTIGTL